MILSENRLPLFGIMLWGAEASGLREERMNVPSVAASPSMQLNPAARSAACDPSYLLFPGFQRDEIIDNGRDVRRFDRRLVGAAHLVDFALPLGARQSRLGQHHAGGMASEAIVVDGVRLAIAREHAPGVGKFDVDRMQRPAGPAKGRSGSRRVLRRQ